MKIIETFVGALALGLAAMTFGAQAQDKGTVGIAMPTKSSLRWICDGNELVKQRSRRRATTPTCNMPKTTFRTSSPRSRTW